MSEPLDHTDAADASVESQDDLPVDVLGPSEASGTAPDDLGPMEPELIELASLAAHTVSELKGEDVVVIDVRGRTSYCDVLVLCTAVSGRQVRAMANQLVSSHKNDGRGRPLGVEGIDSGRWALVDMGDVLVHIFDQPWRGYYDLDGLWVDAPRVDFDELGLQPDGTRLQPEVEGS